MRVTLAQAGSQHLVQVNAPELEEPSEPHLWQSVSSVLWAEDSSPTHPPMSARTVSLGFQHSPRSPLAALLSCALVRSQSALVRALQPVGTAWFPLFPSLRSALADF